MRATIYGCCVVRKPTAVGCNIFAGGFTLGVSDHFKILAHLEHDGYATEVAKKNIPRLEIFDSPDRWPDKKHFDKQGGIDFLYSNPPCAVWSVASSINRGAVDGRWQRDPRLQRVKDIFGLLAKYQPTVWCWESVTQAYTRGRILVDELIARADEEGYAATCVLLNAAFLGAPQHRKRFFLVFHRVRLPWEKYIPDFEAEPITPGQVLKGIKADKLMMSAPTPKVLKLIAKTKPGERLVRTFERLNRHPKIAADGHTIGRPSFLFFRLHPDRTPGVVFADRTIHYKEDRYLALNEVGALNGFPASWDWVSKKHERAIAQGVLPPVGRWLAKVVAAGIRRNEPATLGDPMLVDFRTAPGLIQGISAAVPLAFEPPTDLEGRKDPKRRPKNPGNRVPRAPARAFDPGLVVLPRRFPRPEDGEQSGTYLRRLLRTRAGEFTDEQLAAMVRVSYANRKTTPADVAWNRGQLKRGRKD